MNDHDRSRATDDSTREGDRRRLLRMLGVGGAVALAGPLTSSREAHAGHGGSNVLHIGEHNSSPGTSSPNLIDTTLDGNFDGTLFFVTNQHPDGFGVRAETSTGTAVAGDELSGSGTGVRGNSFTTGTGVEGFSENGTGVVGHSDDGTGVQGLSESGVAGAFWSNTGQALHVEGPAHFRGPGDPGDQLVTMFSSHDNFVLGVENPNNSEGSGGILVSTSGGKPAIEGDALATAEHAGVGVQGVSGGGETFGQGPGVGVQGISGSGPGVQGHSQNGSGVEGFSENGVGVHAGSASGLALNVVGTAAFSTAGSDMVPTGQDSVFVAHPVTADSHISVTLTSDPGRRALAWVERASDDSGFTVHLSQATPGPGSGGPGSPGLQPATSLSYLVVEPSL